MSQYVDIAVFGKDGTLQLLVEAKSKRGASSRWAAKFRRNMYAHGHLPYAPFFLLALPDQFFLWKDVEDPHASVEPNYCADPTPLLRPYFERAGASSPMITEESLELVLSAWLDRLTSNSDRSNSTWGDRWLQASGLLDAVRDGYLDVQGAGVT